MSRRYCVNKLPIVLKIIYHKLRKKSHTPRDVYNNERGQLYYYHTHHRRHVIITAMINDNIVIDKEDTSPSPLRTMSAHNIQDPNFNLEELVEDLHNWLIRPWLTRRTKPLDEEFAIYPIHVRGRW